MLTIYFYLADSLEFFTPPSSPELIQDDVDDMQNAEEGPLIFIEG